MFLKEEGEGICQNPKCPDGNPPTNFQGIGKGYSAGCCNSCSQSLPKTKEKIKQTNIEKYGKPYHTQVEKICEKRRQSYLERYGVDNPMKVKEFRENSINTRTEVSDEIQKVREQTNLKKFGAKNVMQNKDIASKLSTINSDKSKDVVIPKLKNVGFTVLTYTKCTGICLLQCDNCHELIRGCPSDYLYNGKKHICKR